MFNDAHGGERLTRNNHNNNNNNNGTIIITIIKQFESHAIASTLVASSCPIFAAIFCCRHRSLAECAMRIDCPQRNRLNGHNHNRNCVHAMPVPLLLQLALPFGRLSFVSFSVWRLPSMRTGQHRVSLDYIIFTANYDVNLALFCFVFFPLYVGLASFTPSIEIST